MTRQGTDDKGVNVWDNKIDAFGERLNVAIERAGGSTSMAKIADVSTSVLSKWRTGKSEPTRVNLINMAKAANVSVEWLVSGEGSPDGSFSISGEVATAGSVNPLFAGTPSGYSSIPIYDVRASAGHGSAVPQENVAESLMFKSSWIHQELHAQPNDLYLIYVDGESMEPTLRPGDLILVDRRSADAVPRDGIYVIRMDGSLLVKRLQRLPGRKVKATSDNPAYQPFDIELDAPGEDLAIIGRVVWAGRRM